MLGKPSVITDKTISQLYKELETSNFKQQRTKLIGTQKTLSKLFETKINDSLRIKVLSNKKDKNKEPLDQLELFQGSMKVLLICGQYLGLFPINGILNPDVSKIRFTFKSVKFLIGMIMFVSQLAATLLCFYRLVKNHLSIVVISFFSFFCTTTVTTFLFLRVATKWSNLMKDIARSSLDKYVDVSIKSKCIIHSSTLLLLAVLEHFLACYSKVTATYACYSNNSTFLIYKHFIELTFPWYTEVGLPFSIPASIVLQIINTISTLYWNYSDVFLVCISFYLVSILKQINKALVEAEHKFHPPSFWGSLREDYTRAIRLITSFDSVISGIMLTSFASNLFFICLQLYNVLSNGIRSKPAKLASCPTYTSGLFYGYEFQVYFIYSLAFVLGRFLAVSLIAARVHAASLEPATTLYALPSTAYCTEVQRFIEQVHGSNVALTGLQFFSVTRGLILTVAGTVVTYELVLIQLNEETSS